jgi:putative oxygen-independent coproporphyrinogen III oxidase
VIGLYVHVPYCAVRCSYCDFYLVPGRDRDLSAYLAALCAEIRSAGREFPGRTADTVHMGGGTPSLLSPAHLQDVLESLRSSFSLVPESEITLESNPEDLDRERLAGYAAAGVNRLTIGVQSLDDRLLRLMRRPHDARQAFTSVAEARRSPVRSVGVDLILGFPGQETGPALRDVSRLADLGVDHMSLYLLELHEKTVLGRELTLGKRSKMNDEESAWLYEEASDLLARHGFEQYEISNFARPGHRSRHNVKYWTDREYLGFGPSAHSYMSGRRWSNAANLRAYLAGGGGGRTRAEEPGSRGTRAVEALLAGLRLAEGVDLGVLRARYGADFVAPDDAVVRVMEAAGFLARDSGRLRLTRRGRLVSNEVFERLLPPALQLT